MGRGARVDAGLHARDVRVRAAARAIGACSWAVLAAACATAPPDFTETIPETTVSFDMVWVPAAGVYLGRTEVTWEEFLIWYESRDVPEGADAGPRPSPFYLSVDQGWGMGRRPAIRMSRHSAEQYCAWLSARTGRRYRLPTEAEWEAACDGSGDAVVGRETTMPVASGPPNALGLYDTLGNAWEWVAGDPPRLRGGAYNSAAASPSDRLEYDAQWNARDPQRPRGIWWVVDAPFVGMRLACEP